MVRSADKYHPLDRDDLRKILEKYNVNRIFVGHTIFDDITTFYHYKVIAVNVDNQENKEKERGRGVMIEKDGSMFVVYDSGKQEPLLTEVIFWCLSCHDCYHHGRGRSASLM